MSTSLILAGLTLGVMASPGSRQATGLTVGKVAPDFTATDQHGVRFKLSDYRGKVVVVDFWGDW